MRNEPIDFIGVDYSIDNGRRLIAGGAGAAEASKAALARLTPRQSSLTARQGSMLENNYALARFFSAKVELTLSHGANVATARFAKSRVQW